LRRGRKLPAMVCAWPPRRARRGWKGSPKKSRPPLVAGKGKAASFVSDCRSGPGSCEVGLRCCIYNGCIILDCAGGCKSALVLINLSARLIGVAMPIFEYRCEQCGHKFEAILFGEQKAECPSCHARKLEPQLSTFSVSTKSSAAPAPAGCGQNNCCMMGGCSEN